MLLAVPYRKVRPHPNELVERNERLLEYHEQHPEATFEELGAQFGISASRAYEIVQREERKPTLTSQ